MATPEKINTPSNGIAAQPNGVSETSVLIPQVDATLLRNIFSILFSATQPEPYSEDDEDGTSKPFKHVSIPNKGVGTLATRAIKRGEMLFSEPPLIIWPQDITPAQARANVESMSPRAQKLFWELSNAKPEGLLDEVLAIRATNGFAVELPPLPGSEEEAGDCEPKIGSMIFPTVARLNHSCLPNADQAMNWEVLRMEVWAMDDIPEGAEIMIEYTSSMIQKSRDDRRALLYSTFAFHCSCDLCAASPAAISESDVRRERIGALVKEVGKPGAGAETRAKKMEMLEEMWRMVRAEGYKCVPEFDDKSVSQAYAMFSSLRAKIQGAVQSEENE